jgi:hypothetical protein
MRELAAFRVIDLAIIAYLHLFIHFLFFLRLLFPFREQSGGKLQEVHEEGNAGSVPAYSYRCV